MSICTFLASTAPMPPVSPSQSYPFAVDLDHGTVYDGGADDNFFLHPFIEVSTYTDKPYAVWLEWNYTDGRANRLLEYIKNILNYTEIVEFWHIWLMDYWEFEDRPVIHNRTVSIEELTAAHIKALVDAEIWNKPDQEYPDRPSFYRLIITK